MSTNTDIPKSEWTETFRRFEQLYWTELSMVEDGQVKAAMKQFYTNLQWVNSQSKVVPEEQWREVQQLSYQLARSLRKSIEESWGVNLNKEPSKHD